MALNPGWHLFVTPGIVEQREFPPSPKMAGADTCMGVGLGRAFGCRQGCVRRGLRLNNQFNDQSMVVAATPGK